MAQSYRILMVEDRPEDAELTGYYLRRAGMQCEIRCVEDRRSFEKEIHGFHPLAIVCDLSLPAFSGFEALDIARNASPGTPFIFFTGSIPSKEQQRAKSDGAIAIVMKGEYEELVTILQQALEVEPFGDSQEIASRS